MTNNRLAILALVGLLALTAYALYADAVHESQISRFMQQGRRFTAQDGQALCERVAKLEPQPLPCPYGTP